MNHLIAENALNCSFLRGNLIIIKIIIINIIIKLLKLLLFNTLGNFRGS